MATTLTSTGVHEYKCPVCGDVFQEPTETSLYPFCDEACRQIAAQGANGAVLKKAALAYQTRWNEETA